MKLTCKAIWRSDYGGSTEAAADDLGMLTFKRIRSHYSSRLNPNVSVEEGGVEVVRLGVYWKYHFLVCLHLFVGLTPLAVRRSTTGRTGVCQTGVTPLC